MDSRWNTGSISFSNGNQLNGWVKYNDKLRIVSYQPYNDKNISRVFREDDITRVELYDEHSVKPRKLYSLAFKNSATGNEEILLFEVLKEFKNFAVLSRRDPVNASNKKHRGSLIGPIYAFPFKCSSNNNGAPFTFQIETIYVVNDHGDWDTFFKESVRTGKFAPKSKVVKKDLLRSYISAPHFDQLKSYARENRLKLSRKEDLVKVLDYYDSLLKEDSLH